MDYLHKGFTQGFNTGFSGNEFLSIAPNHPSTEEFSAQVKQYILKGLKSEKIAGPFSQPPHPHFRSSPIFLREKKTPGKYRCIQNLSFPYDGTSINDSIPDSIKSVQYATIKDAIFTIQKIGKYTYLAKFDILEAFTNLPVAQAEQHLLGFSFQQEYYYSRVLPQGMGTSCVIFEYFSSALEWVIRYKFHIACHHILDDFIIFEESYERCEAALSLILSFLDYIGVPVEPSKTEGPTQCLTFVGVELDTILMESRLPLGKVTECLALIDNFLQVNKVTLKQIQVLTGKLCFATSTLPCGRPFLRRLYDLTAGLDKPFYHRRLTIETKSDLMVWKQFLMYYNGKQFITHLPLFPVTLGSDASSLVGYGAVCGCEWIYGLWPPEWQADLLTYNIDVKEFYAVLACIATFRHFLRGHRVRFACDNLPVVSMVNKLTSTSKHVMPLIRDLALLCLRNDIHIEAFHIYSGENFLCDRISRGLHSHSVLQEFGMSPYPTPVPMSLLPTNFKLKLQN